MNLTANELVEALEKVMDRDSTVEGCTVAELRDAMGYTVNSERPVREAVRRLLKSGKWELVTVVRERMNGVKAATPGYRPKKC